MELLLILILNLLCPFNDWSQLWMVWCDRMWRKNWEGSKHWASAGLSEQQIKCNLQYCKIRRRAKCSVERTIRTLTLSSINIFPRLTFYQICPIPVLTFALNDKWKWKSIWCLLFLFCLSLSPIGVGGRNRAEKLDWDFKSFSSPPMIPTYTQTLISFNLLDLRSPHQTKSCFHVSDDGKKSGFDNL